LESLPAGAAFRQRRGGIVREKEIPEGAGENGPPLRLGEDSLPWDGLSNRPSFGRIGNPSHGREDTQRLSSRPKALWCSRSICARASFQKRLRDRRSIWSSTDCRSRGE